MAGPGVARLELIEDAGAPELVRVCLVCGATMLDRGCKLRCPRCHYFASCSDYL
jgi:rubrerythrin